MRWSTRWETSLEPVDHAELAVLLARAFPSVAASFTGGRSWVGARPELRIVGHLGGEPVAHVGLIRRFLRAPDHDGAMLVGDVGLVAVHPDRQGRGLGAELMSTVAAVLGRLAVPHGFLTCAPHARPFYERCGWTALHGHPVRTVRVDHSVEAGRGHGMLLPVLGTRDDWPSGPIERDGQEI